ncbi:MAG: class I SAM-dependent methyltransferase [Solirubrobacterales bacterium]|nr:class I SAM-dependent methyltransferase [Solirubrobacterales bacterium]MBV9915831.1 class I SAM-dependent methyltransferase [Solirubrobacterales bacterium]
MRSERWNHNLHRWPLIAAAMPPECRRALDVGCGEGTLTRQLRRSVSSVTGIDCDPPSIAAAGAHPEAGDIAYVQADFLTARFSPGSFDLITAVASLHHMDADAALRRMRALLAPGGVLVAVGLARSRYPGDLPRDVASVVVNRLSRLTRNVWESPSPPMPPRASYAEMRETGQRLLPGARFRRHLLWRYSLVWQRPLS